ncbi:MAG: hypothetical protein HC780_01230 [Leptolyngbyaceae cyanobacterium CSU_1_3]|nr:hypothetical protein [Leptolyngbyaceae cyanobacterium CSU_1_3]
MSNGNHQICSQPPPRDWQQGAGVCLVFRKQNNRIEGYYGYPHSDAFVCLRGVINGTQIVGQGYLVSWEGSRWDTFPNKPFFWDGEKQLQLAQGKRIRSHPPSQDWILFQKATLNFQSFYLYQKPQMTSPKQLCDWRFEKKNNLMFTA